MPRPRPITSLHTHEHGGMPVACALPSAMGRLHHNRRGNISILFILLAFVFFGSASLVWNTGHAVAAKLHTQTAADASAYSATVWTSRTVNLITGTNMMILRNHGAQISAASSVAVTIGVPIFWAVEIARAVGCAPPPFNLICIAAAVIRVVVEVPPYVSFVSRSAGEAFGNIFSNTFPNRINEIHDFQTDLVNSIPGVVAAQERNLEDYYGVNIRFTVPGNGDGNVTPPLKEGNFLSTLPVVALRFYSSDNNWPSEGNFGNFNSVGRARSIWTGVNVLTIAAMSAVHGTDNYVLTTQFGPLEFGPTSLADRRDFTVVATAIEANASNGFRVMPGLFNNPIMPNDEVIAYAQAETYNGIDGRLSQIGFSIPYPFRVWTTYGWQWQPRLTRGDQLGAALGGDSTLRGIFSRIGVLGSDESELDNVALH